MPSEAARTNADGLAELSEHDPTGRVAGPAQVGRRWLNVAFLQGEEADAVLDLIDRDGPDSAIEHLKSWDYGDEATDAAMENGYVYDEQPPASGTDRTVTSGEYAVTYNHALGHVGLYRQLSTPPDPAILDDPLVPANIRTGATPRAQHTPPAHEGREARRAALGADRDWYGSPASTSTGSPRGLSR